MKELLNEYESYLKFLDKSPSTISSYMRTVKQFIRDEEVEDVGEFEDFDKRWWISWMIRKKDELQNSTIRKKVKQMSSFYGFLVHEDYLDDNCLKHITTPSTSGLHDVEEILNSEQIKTILKSLKDKYESSILFTEKRMNYRNMLLINLEFQTGLRINEMASIKLIDINLENRSLNVRGKNHKGHVSRKVFFNEYLKNMIIEYLKYREGQVIKEEGEEMFFLSEAGEPLGTQTIRKVWNNVVEETNVPKMKFHGIRKIVGSNLIDKGFSLEKVAKWMGHSESVAEKYYQRNTDEMKDMSETNNEWFI
jgi:site-specific recombinase XerD